MMHYDVQYVSICYIIAFNCATHVETNIVGKNGQPVVLSILSYYIIPQQKQVIYSPVLNSFYLKYRPVFQKCFGPIFVLPDWSSNLSHHAPVARCQRLGIRCVCGPASGSCQCNDFWEENQQNLCFFVANINDMYRLIRGISWVSW